MNFKTKLSSITVILLLAGFVNLEAQTNPKEIVEEFFIDYKNDGATKALDKLYSTNKWMERATDAITNVKTKLEGLNEDYVGKYYGYELIAEKKLTESYLLLSYLVKFDRQPIRYTFHFYRPDNKWIIYNFKFDAGIDDEIEESAKLYYLNMD